jgi:four helix bundle protein
VASQRFEDLIVWQKAHAFVLKVYQLTARFPREELFGLTSQLRRAAVSIPANVAEGFKKTGKADKLRFYNTSQGSLEECRYYLLLTRDLKYGETSALLDAVNEVGRLLEAYMGGLRAKTSSSTIY